MLTQYTGHGIFSLEIDKETWFFINFEEQGATTETFLLLLRGATFNKAPRDI